MTKPRSLRRVRKQTRERGRKGLGKLWLGLAVMVFYPLQALLARTRLVGLERLPAEGPVLLVLNHVSHLDPVYDAVTVHRAGRLPRFLAKNTLWNVPLLRGVLSGVEQIPVYRGTTDAQKSLQEAHRALGENKVILIYPDGTITRDPRGWPMTPKVGVARLALEHDVPVIPVARWGTREVYDHYNKKFRPLPRKEVTIKFGEPIDLSAYRAKEEDPRLLREVADLAMQRVRELLGEIREEQPPHEFYSSTPKRNPSGDDA
ncbi:1-acyl-sn-glycerol-3-phosphate acyltransferase [Halopolyspora algeriensis]|uniref:1-acyl-sn-glycerol-3-phosphate acyltransferase n=1 Tax=Halopolyspora algeriensis TaxID=1500506 RepID=A0A368VDH8_9ACTN|nr:lysophospholipid acyltransferase family protein [Halopolyspora algeriensis]RCW39156.1 1-acyl-sn-glycerol-3-phosphate acyltransferase [Halopolyspora algeriensis]TQM56547.1 1-acyl-sn-glycerol-3-phosphate acyltransferase [Halopolyspora algeriensis]